MTTRQRAQSVLTRTNYSMTPARLSEECKSRKGTVFVYNNLWLHASGSPDDRGRAFPSVETQAQECGMDPKDVREARRWLEENGWLRKTERPGKTPMFQVLMEQRKPCKQRTTPGGNAPRVKSPRPLGETPHPTPGGNAPPNKSPLTRPRDQEIEPPLPPVPGGAPQPLAVGCPCRDPEQPAGADRDREGFLIYPAAAAQPVPLPRPETPLQPQAPISTQPQPQQPSAPRPLPQPADPEAIFPVKPKAGRAKACGFEPGEGDVPAALLPVGRELLAFWASKGGKRTERAWAAQLGQLQRIQADARGGTEAVREQLEAGAQAAVFGKAWMAVTFANWERFGAKTTPIIGTGFPGRRPSQTEAGAQALAFIRERDARRAAEAVQRAEVITVPALALAGVA